MALERCSLLEEELGATHREVSPVHGWREVASVCSFRKQDEGCRGGCQMLFVFLAEDLPLGSL